MRFQKDPDTCVRGLKHYPPGPEGFNSSMILGKSQKSLNSNYHPQIYDKVGVKEIQTQSNPKKFLRRMLLSFGKFHNNTVVVLKRISVVSWVMKTNLAQSSDRSQTSKISLLL